MFKKRIKAAKIVFFTIVALTVFAVVLLKNFERHGKGTGELKVLFGNPDIVDGVTISKGVSECVWMDNTRYADHESALREADHFYKMQTAQVAGDKTITSLEYRKQKANETKDEFRYVIYNNVIYQIIMDGKTHVFSLEERAEGFERLWMTREEENILAIIGKKENCLMAYCYNFESGAVEERVLWDGQENPKEFLEWWKTSKYGKNVEMVTKGDRSYVCHTGGQSGTDCVTIIVFEAGDRIFHGEVLLEECESKNLTDFSMNTNGESLSSMAVDLEIILQK